MKAAPRFSLSDQQSKNRRHGCFLPPLLTFLRNDTSCTATASQHVVQGGSGVGNFQGDMRSPSLDWMIHGGAVEIFNVLISVATFHQVLIISELLPSLPSDWISPHRPMRILRFIFISFSNPSRYNGRSSAENPVGGRMNKSCGADTRPLLSPQTALFSIFEGGKCVSLRRSVEKSNPIQQVSTKSI